MPLALVLLQLFNAAAPGIASIVMVLKRKDGSISIVPILDEADAAFQADLRQAADFLRPGK